MLNLVIRYSTRLFLIHMQTMVCNVNSVDFSDPYEVCKIDSGQYDIFFLA